VVADAAPIYPTVLAELALGIKVAPSTVWEILNANGIEPAPQRDRQTWPISYAAKRTPSSPPTSSRSGH
jgi:hypothetical protein